MLKEFSDEKMKKLFCFRYQIDSIKTGTTNKTTKLERINAKTRYVKYTSKASLYEILESDSLYLFCSELSNDSSENKFFRSGKSVDSYITCFYQNNTSDNITVNDCGDVYSQWTSYCSNGGASLDFYFGQGIMMFNEEQIETEDHETSVDLINKQIADVYTQQKDMFDYSILCRDYHETGNFIKMRTYPFQVQYYNNEFYDRQNLDYSNPQIDHTYLNPIKIIADKLKLEMYEVIPLFKHSGFIQESEARIVFNNANNELNRCIKFLTKKDGSKVPYIEIKFGDLDKDNRPCDFVKISGSENMEDAIEKKLREINRFKFSNMYPIIIPQGYNQEKIYDIVEKKIKKVGAEYGLLDKALPKIICQGHLPITKITVAPTRDRKEQRRMLEIFCKSKYWLRNVEICESTIPYNTQNVNHTE